VIQPADVEVGTFQQALLPGSTVIQPADVEVRTFQQALLPGSTLIQPADVEVRTFQQALLDTHDTSELDARLTSIHLVTATPTRPAFNAQFTPPARRDDTVVSVVSGGVN